LKKFAGIQSGRATWEPSRRFKGSTGGQTDSAENEEEEPRDGLAEFNNFRESVFATGTLGAVNFIVRGMNDLPGRKSVMLLSDGFQLFSRDPNNQRAEFSRVLDSLRRLVDLANRSSVGYLHDGRSRIADRQV
jgi:hypothetical protein